MSPMITRVCDRPQLDFRPNFVMILSFPHQEGMHPHCSHNRLYIPLYSLLIPVFVVPFLLAAPYIVELVDALGAHKHTIYVLTGLDKTRKKYDVTWISQPTEATKES